jgi:hypothetical protein
MVMYTHEIEAEFRKPACLPFDVVFRGSEQRISCQIGSPEPGLRTIFKYKPVLARF